MTSVMYCGIPVKRICWKIGRVPLLSLLLLAACLSGSWIARAQQTGESVHSPAGNASVVSEWTYPGVDRQVQKVDRIAGQGPFYPTWPSLEQHQVPEWFRDAKFGLFVHWGPTTLSTAYGLDHEASMKAFNPKHFDADAWAKLFKESGAKFVIPVGEHHDGYAMYDASFTDTAATKMAPKRDFLGELAVAIRKQGLIFGTSSHFEEHFWFYSHPPKPAPPAPLVPRTTPAAHAIQPSEDFLKLWLAQCTDMVDKYHPQLFWFDWEIEQPAFQPYLKQFVAFYYNRAAEWKQKVVVNYKYEAIPEKAGVLDISWNTHRMTWDPARVTRGPWQYDTVTAVNSWFWRADAEYRPAYELLAELSDVVSKNGSYLLNFAPDADGVFPEQLQNIMHGMGKWLAINGEAIYGTRPWVIYGEGPTPGIGPSFERMANATPQDIRFTTKGQVLYAIELRPPAEQTVVIKSLAIGSHWMTRDISSVTMLGSKAKIKWRRTHEGLVIELPQFIASKTPLVFKIS